MLYEVITRCHRRKADAGEPQSGPQGREEGDVEESVGGAPVSTGEADERLGPAAGVAAA